jgi:capsular polysaccharide biosynthesis protein
MNKRRDIAVGFAVGVLIFSIGYAFIRYLVSLP